jgi:hypothetical protein
MSRPLDGPRSDGFRSYAVAIRANREVCLRQRDVQPDPRDPEEERWFKEGIRWPKGGPIDWSALDTALSGKPWER